MIKHFCDICGKDLTGHDHYEGKFKLLAYKYSLSASSNIPFLQDDFSYELCEDCNNKLMEFLKRKKSDGEALDMKKRMKMRTKVERESIYE